MSDGTSVVTTLRGADDAPADSERSLLRVEVLHSPDAEAVGATRALSQTHDLLIGRDVADGLRIRDPRLSRLHLRVIWDAVASGFRYADAGSANGTFVNGYRADTGLLLPHDVIRIGDTLLVSVERDVFAELRVKTLAAGRSGLPVLLQGETGTGKEVLSRALHEASGRAGPFVAVNCAALPKDLAATELFGHARGAFSGAATGRDGLFRAAHGGTLLLDEIGDLPLELQGHLLRALQESCVRPVGSDHDVEIDVRVVAATHVDLDAAVERGAFRRDLLARLAQIVLRVPPLRERRHEIARLLREVVPGVELTASALEAVAIWDFPGNVRELKASIAAARALSDSSTLRVKDLAERVPSASRILLREPPSAPPPGDDTALDRRKRLASLMAKHDGNIAGVARELGKPRAQVYRWLKTLGLPRDGR